MAVETVDLDDAFDAVDEQWSPRVAAALNGQEVKVATLAGEFVWHAHADADELFLVVDGDLTLELRDQPDVRIGDGELAVVPRGVEHRPVAHRETDVLLFEPAGTVNTGDADAGDLTRGERRTLEE